MSTPGDAAEMRLAEGLDFVIINENEVLIQFGTRSYPSELLRDTDLSGALGKVFRCLLRGPSTRSDLLQLAPKEAEIESVLNQLVERGILTTVDKSPVDQYIEFTFTGRSPLAEARVAVLGAGPVGAGIVEGLLQSGVLEITLLDGRKADATWDAILSQGSRRERDSSLPVQMALRDRFHKQGHRGVVALDAELDRSGIEVAVDGSDIVVLALERPDPRVAHLVNRCCLRSDRAWLHSAIDGNFGTVGPLFLPPDTGCYNDFRTLAEAADPNPSMARAYGRHAMDGASASAFFPGLPAHAAIVAGFASLAIVHFLIRGTAFAMGRVLIIDFDRFLLDVEDLIRLPRCPVCGPARKPTQPAFSAEVVTRAGAERTDG